MSMITTIKLKIKNFQKAKLLFKISNESNKKIKQAKSNYISVIEFILEEKRKNLILLQKIISFLEML